MILPVHPHTGLSLRARTVIRVGNGLWRLTAGLVRELGAERCAPAGKLNVIIQEAGATSGIGGIYSYARQQHRRQRRQQPPQHVITVVTAKEHGCECVAAQEPRVQAGCQ